MFGFGKKGGDMEHKAPDTVMQASEIANDFKIAMGSEVRDLMTGFIGRTNNVVVEFNGNIRYTIHPKAKEDGSLPEPWSIDEDQLEVLDKGVSHLAKPLQPSPFTMGAHVKDKITGFDGVITAALWFMNGCLFYSVDSKTARHEGRPVTMEFSVDRLQEVEDAKPVEAPRERTGGPMIRVARR
jgi:hypothetical protein